MAEFDVYQRFKWDESCDKCKYHGAYLLVATRPFYQIDGSLQKRYFITTNSSFYSGASTFLHYWSDGNKPTKCLNDFEKIKTIKV